MYLHKRDLIEGGRGGQLPRNQRITTHSLPCYLSTPWRSQTFTTGKNALQDTISIRSLLHSGGTVSQNGLPVNFTMNDCATLCKDCMRPCRNIADAYHDSQVVRKSSSIPAKGNAVIKPSIPYSAKNEAGQWVTSGTDRKCEANPHREESQRELLEAPQQALVPPISVLSIPDECNDPAVAPIMLQSDAKPEVFPIEIHIESHDPSECGAEISVAMGVTDAGGVGGAHITDDIGVPTATLLPNASEPDTTEPPDEQTTDPPTTTLLPDPIEPYSGDHGDISLSEISPNVDEIARQYAIDVPIPEPLTAVDDECGEHPRRCAPTTTESLDEYAPGSSNYSSDRSEMTWPYCKMPKLDEMENCDSRIKGLLYYRKWWYLRDVDISVKGQLLCGTPIMFREKTLRIVNDAYSYFIPMDNIDYIRTPDGLDMSQLEFE